MNPLELGGPHLQRSYPSTAGRILPTGLAREANAKVKRRRRGWLARRMLLAADLGGLCCAFLFQALVFSDPAGPSGASPALGDVALFGASLPLWFGLAQLYGLYDHDEERTGHSTPDDVADVFHLVAVGTWLVVGLTLLTGLADPELTSVLAFGLSAAVLLVALRAIARAVCRRSPRYVQNVVVVGAGAVGQRVARKLLQHPEYGVNVVGFVDEAPSALPPELRHLAYLGRPAELLRLIRLLDVDRVVLGFSEAPIPTKLELIRRLKESNVQVDLVPWLFDVIGPNVAMHTVEGLPLVGLPPVRSRRGALRLKRSLDVAAAAMGLVCLAPLMAVVAIAIKLGSPGPVLYRSERIGRRGKHFHAYKFRTMRLEQCRGTEYGGEEAEKAFAALMQDESARAEFLQRRKVEKDPRVTRIGCFLRGTSLDELPQLMNVLRGDMSLVGPRPITAEEAQEYGVDGRSQGPGLLSYWQIPDLRPGLTGYWQINGRSVTTYEDRVRMDMAYATSWSLRLDLMILAKTVRVLFARQGAY